MNRRTLLILVGILAVLAGLAGLSGLKGKGGAVDALFLPGLHDRLNDIGRITVTGPGNVVVATLVRGQDRWTVAERAGYPADVGKIRATLLALGDAKIVEEKTANPEYYGRLGVEDIASPGAGGRQLDLEGPGETTRVILGDGNEAGMTYARRVGEAGSWLITGRYDLGKSPADWLDRTVLEIPSSRIRSVAITRPGGEPLVIEKADKDAAEFTVRKLPPGRKLAYPGAVEAVTNVLASLALDDVHPRESLGDHPGKPTVARYETFDGLVIEASAWRLPDGVRVTFVASADPAQADAAKEAEALNARLAGWVYTLPGYKTEQFTRTLAGLLEAPPAMPMTGLPGQPLG